MATSGGQTASQFLDVARKYGTTAAAINAAITAANPHDTLWLDPSRTWNLDGTVANSGKSIVLESEGATLIATTHAAQVNMTGAWGTEYPVTSVTAGTITHNAEVRNILNVVVTGTLPYERGDVVKVYADDIIPGARPGDGTLESRSGQFATVYSSTANLLILLTKELLDPLTTNIKVSKLDDTAVTIRNVNFDTSTALMNDGGKSNTVVLSKLVRAVLENVVVYNATAQAIQYNDCYETRIINPRIDNANDDSGNSQFGYGLLDNSSAMTVVTGLDARFVRHGYSDDSPRIAANSGPSGYGRSAWNTLENPTTLGTSNSSLDTHACSHGLTIINPQLHGTGGPGIGMRGRNITVIGGYIGTGHDVGVYAFSESGTNTYSYGHRMEGTIIAAPVTPVQAAVNKLSNVRDTEMNLSLSDVKIVNPTDLTVWAVNANVELDDTTIRNIQMPTASTKIVVSDNSEVQLGDMRVKMKAGISATGLNFIKVQNAGIVRGGKIKIDFNGTTNATRFNPLIDPTDTTNLVTIDLLNMTSNPSVVMPYQSSHTDSYLDYVVPAGNALGGSSDLIPVTDAGPSNPQHQLSRTLSREIIYEYTLAGNYTQTSLRSGRMLGQRLLILNKAGGFTLTINNVASITTLTGAAIALTTGQNAKFYWTGATWWQIA